MARRKRIWIPHMCHHIMLRGIGGMPLFVDEQDRSMFCLRLQKATETHLHKVHAFCLMTNHIHLVLEPTSPLKSLADCVHAFAFRYAQHFNKRYGRQGYLYQGRFHSILVEDGAYLRRLTRYIHLNPVEARLVNLPEEYIWSSHNAYFGRATYVWLETNSILSWFGRDRVGALSHLADYTAQNMEAKVDSEAIEKAFHTGIFGSQEFTEKYSPEILKKSDATALTTYTSIEDLLNVVCHYYQVTVDELRSTNKSAKCVDGRSVLAYANRYIPDSSLGKLSQMLGKNNGTLSKLARRVETTPSLLGVVNHLITTLGIKS